METSTPKNTSKIGQKGKTYNSQSREIIENVRDFSFEEKKGGKLLIPLNNAIERTARATGVSESTIKRIHSLKPLFNTPGKKRPRESTVTNLDSFDNDVVRRRIYRCYKGEFPTMQKLHKYLQVEINFTGSAESLRKIVLKLGFKYKKVDGRKLLLERSDIIAKRHSYLRKIRSLQDHRNIVYLDETWLNENYSVNKKWQDFSPETSKAPPLGKGHRLIILHAGSSEGFVPDCLLSFVSKSGKEDYHQDMNATVFRTWFEDKLLKNISPNSIIVMDNAPYHSVQVDRAPSSNNRKNEMFQWLIQHNVPCNELMLKAELLELVKQNKQQYIRYEIDELASQHGHQVLHHPPYHCDFNPIELI